MKSKNVKILKINLLGIRKKNGDTYWKQEHGARNSLEGENAILAVSIGH